MCIIENFNYQKIFNLANDLYMLNKIYMNEVKFVVTREVNHSSINCNVMFFIFIRC